MAGQAQWSEEYWKESRNLHTFEDRMQKFLSGNSEMFFTLRQISIPIWTLVVQTQLSLIFKHQQTCLTRVSKVWSYEFDEKTASVGWNVSLGSSRKVEHAGTGMPWDFQMWDFWALFICSRNAQSGCVCKKKVRRGLIPVELNQSRSFVCRNLCPMKIRQNAQSALNRESVGEKFLGSWFSLRFCQGQTEVFAIRNWDGNKQRNLSQRKWTQRGEFQLLTANFWITLLTL